MQPHGGQFPSPSTEISHENQLDSQELVLVDNGQVEVVRGGNPWQMPEDDDEMEVDPIMKEKVTRLACSIGLSQFLVSITATLAFSLSTSGQRAAKKVFQLSRLAYILHVGLFMVFLVCGSHLRYFALRAILLILIAGLWGILVGHTLGRNYNGRNVLLAAGLSLGYAIAIGICAYFLPKKVTKVPHVIFLALYNFEMFLVIAASEILPWLNDAGQGLAIGMVCVCVLGLVLYWASICYNIQYLRRCRWALEGDVPFIIMYTVSPIAESFVAVLLLMFGILAAAPLT